MNKATTNSYFPFFGVPYHLILHGKISRRRNYLESFLLEGGGGVSGEAVRVEFSVLGFFWVSSGNRQVCADKTEW